MASWTCPYCQQKATIIGQNVSSDAFRFTVGKQQYSLLSEVVRCPNDECGQYTLKANLWESSYNNISGTYTYGNLVEQWGLIPDSLALVFPSYVPAAILDDYREACLIEERSPKASATLSRRCLQGMIRDFWKIKKNRLIDEIEELKHHVDIATWGAIDGVRTIGNIGAHMEKDINVMVDVDPGEARLLIELIETLLDDWYVARHEKQQRLAKVTAAAAAKVAKNT